MMICAARRWDGTPCDHVLTKPRTGAANPPPGARNLSGVTHPSRTVASRVARRRRRRRLPEDAEREILDAAIGLLEDSAAGPVTVSALMARTSLGRSAFYTYFRDIPDLLRRLLAEIECDLSARRAGWFDGDGEPAEDCLRSMHELVRIHLRHGLVLRAIAEASSRDPDLGAGHRRAAVEGFVTAVTERVAREHARGRVHRRPHPASAAALMAMTDAYLREKLGRHPREDPAKVAQTLTIVWSQTLYGYSPASLDEAPAGVSRPTPHGE